MELSDLSLLEDKVLEEGLKEVELGGKKLKRDGVVLVD